MTELLKLGFFISSLTMANLTFYALLTLKTVSSIFMLLVSRFPTTYVKIIW